MKATVLVAKGIVAVILIALWQGAFAADWTINQVSTLSGTEARLTQENSTSSQQGANGVQLNVEEDSVASLTQTATINAPTLTLTQSGANPNSSVQAINSASAQSITQLTQSVSQPTGNARMMQTMTGGTGNIQAMNYANARDVISASDQSFTGQTLTIEKDLNTPTGNIQSVNYAKARSYTGDIQQTVTVSALTYENRPGGANDIRMNSIEGDTTNASVTQMVTVQGTLTIDPSSDPTVILNYMAP